MKFISFFLLLLLLSGCLGDAKRMDIILPKDVKDSTTTKVNEKMAVTILLEGNKDTVYVYEGKFDSSIALKKFSFPDLRAYVAMKNEVLADSIGNLRKQFKSGLINDSVFAARKRAVQEYYNNSSPFFIVKWGGNANYSDVVYVIDELKICDVEKYALTPVSGDELTFLSKETHRHYAAPDQPK